MHSDSTNRPKERGGKYFEHKSLQDPLGRIFFGIIIIWLGISFFLMEQDFFYNGEWWSYFLLGLGIIFFAEALVRMSRPEYRRPYTGKIIAGAVLVAIGAGRIYNMENWWPLILIAIGVIIIVINVRQKNKL